MPGARFRFFVLSSLVLVLVGCATTVPREITSKVTYHGDFASLQKSPERFAGEFVILGGRIVEISNDPPSSSMIVVQFPLDSGHKPQVSEPSQGRFLLRSESFLDPAVYNPGSLVTVAGTVTGKDIRPVGSYPYAYPVINLTRIWKWEPVSESYPRFHFGIGVGTWF
jgi:outer membrane lipoprotein